jgi:hypothetical protein
VDHRVFILALVFLYSLGASPHGAAAPMRVRATSIISYLVIQFSSSSVQSTLPNRAGDNLVSRGSGFASTVMSPRSGIGLGSTTDDLLAAILGRLDSMEVKLQPLEHHFVGLGGDGGGALHMNDGSGVLTMSARVGYSIGAGGLSMGSAGLSAGAPNGGGGVTK